MSLPPPSWGSTLPAKKKFERLLIVRLSAMGDVIHTLPAARFLRSAFPGAYLGWLIEERWAELLCAAGAARRGRPWAARPLVDEVHTVNLKAWGRSLSSLSTLAEIAKVWNDVRDAGYDAAIDLQGAIRSAVLARWSGAAAVYGAAEPRESPASLWYTRRVLGQGRHVIEQNLSIAKAVAGEARAAGPADMDRDLTYDGPCDLPRDPEAENRIAQQLSAREVGDFAILNPGAGWGAKRWPAERYGEVARGLAGRGLASILNLGPGEEGLVRAVEAASGGAAQAIRCSITELIALTRRSRLLVGGDTGPLHLAAALRIPVVGIYGPTDPARNGPYGTRSIVLRNAESVTTYARRAAADDGMLGIGGEAVLAAADRLLSGDGR